MDELSARRRDLYLTTHNFLKKNIHPQVGFETAIPTIERPQTYALVGAPTGIGLINFLIWRITQLLIWHSQF